MAHRTQHRRRKARKVQRRGSPTESRASDAITVAWTVTVITLVACELGVLFSIFYLRIQPAAAHAQALFALTRFAAVFLAIVSMGMLPIVYRIRKIPPPPGLVAIAALLASLPIVGVIVASF